MTRSLLLGLAALLAPFASAQYSSDPAVNLALSTEASDQSQPKLSPTEDGGTWVSWFDGIGSGWDVRVQRLDAAGNEVFPSGGLLVADRAYSSTQDYDLSTASNGDALLAYRNNPSGGDEIEVARVSTGGGVLWTATVASGGAFLAAPSITGTGNDQAVVGWTENSSVRFQGLDQAGNTTWGQGTTLTPATGTYNVGNVCEPPGSGGGAVASIIHQTGGFGSPRLLLAQRFNAVGAQVWGTGPVTVFGGGSLQFGAFPECQAVNDGSTLFAWYSSSPSLQCFVQRLNAQGQALFAADGVAVSTNTTRVRTSPSAFVGITGFTYVYWREQNASQSESGLYGQRIDSAGNRTWGPDGMVFVALSPQPLTQVQAMGQLAGSNGGGVVSWVSSPSFGDDRVRALVLFGNGTTLGGTIDVSTVPSAKSRLVSKRAVGPLLSHALIAWSDDRDDGGDIYIQDINRDALLGTDRILGGFVPGCNPNSTSIGTFAVLVARGSAVISDGDLRLTTQPVPTNQFGYYLTSDQTAFVPFAGGSSGNLCLGGFIGRLNGPGQVLNSGPSGLLNLTVDLASLPLMGGTGSVVSGQTQTFQAWFRDGATSNFSNAVSILGL